MSKFIYMTKKQLKAKYDGVVADYAFDLSKQALSNPFIDVDSKVLDFAKNSNSAMSDLDVQNMLIDIDIMLDN